MIYKYEHIYLVPIYRLCIYLGYTYIFLYMHIVYTLKNLQGCLQKNVFKVFKGQ